MASITEQALLLFRQSQSLKRQGLDLLKDEMRSLTIEGHDDTITETESRNPHTDPFKLIQSLDTQLHAHVSSKDYDNALKKAIEMQNLIPELHFGYQRAAQIHLIRNEYEGAYRAYYSGFKEISQQDEIDLLCESAKESQHIFDQAAEELTKVEQFDEARRIACWMIILVRTSPLGYLRAGETYEMQGKTKAAMDVYLQGISSTSFDMQLVNRMISLQQRIDRAPQYDFITQLPLEITSCITKYLFICELVECMSVCESWKYRIQQCAEAWRMFGIDYPGKKFHIATFQHVKPFVQEVVITHGTSNASFLHDLLVSIGNGEFKNLTYLCLDSATMEPQYKQDIIRILERVDLTRLDLEFVFNMQESYIPLHQVLESCSHLKELVYHTDAFPTRINYDLLPQQPTMITHLSIGGYPYYDETVEDPSFFIPLIPLFPNLVWLCITDNGPGDLQVILENCTHLRVFLVTHGYPHLLPLDFPYSKRIPKGTTKGLLYLEIDGFVEPEDVVDIVAKNCNTLETVKIRLEYVDSEGYVRVDPNWNWKNLPKINCPVLKKLHMSMDYYWPFEQWIGECSALTDKKLECKPPEEHTSADNSDDDDNNAVTS